MTWAILNTDICLNIDIGLSLRGQYSFKIGLAFYKTKLPLAL